MHNDKADIFNRCQRILVEHMNIKAENVTPRASLIDDLGADSLDMVELVMAAEEEFGVTISDEEGEKMLTVQNAVDAIAYKLA